MDPDSAADELYALAPAGFTARRAELVAQARADGDRGLAKQLASLRRPTVAAWLVNRFVASGDGSLDELLALGHDMRAAQSGLLGDRLKELTTERHRLVAAIVRRATASQAASESVRREVEATLVAAVADEAAAGVVASGRLTRALSYSGFGEVDLSAATALPRSRTPRTAPSRDVAAPPTDLTERREAKARRSAGPSARGRGEEASRRDGGCRGQGAAWRDEAAKATEQARELASATRLEAAREAVARTAETAAEAARRREAANASTAELTERAASLQRELSDVRHRLVDATREAGRADRAADVAAGAARQAARDLSAAERAQTSRSTTRR